MKNLIISELERIFSSKKSIITLIILIICNLLLSTFVMFCKVGFYDGAHSVPLDALNFPPYILRESHLFLIFIVCPIFLVDSFNAEITNSYYRMIMIRPYSKLQMFMSKLISQALILALIVLIMLGVTTAFGFLTLPVVSNTTYYTSMGTYSLLGAMLFNLKFYFYEYLIVLVVLSVNAFVSVLMPNSVLAFLGGIGLISASVYVSDKFEFLILSCKNIFASIYGLNSYLLICSPLIILIGLVASSSIFVKRDFKW